MKREWLVTNVTAVGSPDRVEHTVFGAILGVFQPIQATCVVEETHCDVRIPC